MPSWTSISGHEEERAGRGTEETPWALPYSAPARLQLYHGQMPITAPCLLLLASTCPSDPPSRSLFPAIADAFPIFPIWWPYPSHIHPISCPNARYLYLDRKSQFDVSALTGSLSALQHGSSVLELESSWMWGARLPAWWFWSRAFDKCRGRYSLLRPPQINKESVNRQALVYSICPPGILSSLLL